MHRKPEEFLFAPASPRRLNIFRVYMCAVVVIIFWRHPLNLRDVPINPFSPAAYDTVFMTGGYWWLMAAALAIFASGWRPHVTGLIACAVVFPLIFVRGMFIGMLDWASVLLYPAFLVPFSTTRITGVDRKDDPGTR